MLRSMIADEQIGQGSFRCPRCSKESRTCKLPPELRCPTCRGFLALDREERFSGVFTCTRCAIAAGSALPRDVQCPSCCKPLWLDDKERLSGSYTCPRCQHAVAGGAVPNPAHSVTALVAPTDEQIQRQARRNMLHGGVFFVAGVALTVSTFVMGGSTFIIAYGPIIFGAWRFLRGAAAYKPRVKVQVPRAVAMLRGSDAPTSRSDRGQTRE